MANAETGSEGNSTNTPETNESPGKGRPPSMVLTSETDIISLQKELKSVVSGEFFRNKTDHDYKYGGLQRRTKIPH
jgi:hypothetical protein